MPVDDLRVGDRLRYRAGGAVVWGRIRAIEELPASRRLHVERNYRFGWRMRRRGTLVVRAERQGER